jgi:O-antigen ligase
MARVKTENFILYTATIISLIFTPMSFDALIIPKIALLFSLALFLLPEFFTNLKSLFSFQVTRMVIIIGILFIMQALVVMVLSPAPFEQQFFGRTGRGLGFTTLFSMITVLLVSVQIFKLDSSWLIIKWIAIAGLFSSIYALIQRAGLDPFNWNSRTNGIIGTIGNPNFQSSFTIMAFMPAILFFWSILARNLTTPIILVIFLATLYFTQSTQGYITLFASLLVFALNFLWFKKRLFFTSLFIGGMVASLFALAGMVNKGPLSYYLYKPSVQSRGDFWRAAINTANDNPIFGTGLDSFGDSFLIYKDKAKVEMTDNAHNYFLEYAATGGYPLAIFYLLLVVITLYSFISLQRKIQQFNTKLTVIFCVWLVFQLQSIISPGTITFLVWNAIISGYLIGANAKYKVGQQNQIIDKHKPIQFRLIANLLFISGLIIMLPLFNADRKLQTGATKRNATIVMQALTSYPESSVKYNLFIQQLFTSNLFPQALEMGRAAVAFNPNAVSAWAAIFVNPQAPLQERIAAKEQILRLDPMNTEVFSYKLE